jgi:hypothetical protein
VLQGKEKRGQSIYCAAWQLRLLLLPQHSVNQFLDGALFQERARGVNVAFFQKHQ